MSRFHYFDCFKQSMPDPSNDDFSRSMRNGPSKIFLQEEEQQQQQSRGGGGSYASQPSGSSTYSTLKDSYRSCNSGSSTIKESSPPYTSSNYSTLKHNHNQSNGGGRSAMGYDAVDFSRESSSFSPPGNIDYIDEDIPYHARQTSQPFSYGATNEMIKHQKLSSPSLVRKASLRGNAPVVELDDILGENLNHNHHHHQNHYQTNNRRPQSPLSSNNTPDPLPEFANGSDVAKPIVINHRNDSSDG